LIKGGGGAHAREKIVAAAADRFIVIVSSNKMVPRLGPPVPLELMVFGFDSILRALPGTVPRQGAPLSPDGGVLADYHGDVDDPERLAARFGATAGVVAHGLFPPALVSLVLIGHADRVETFQPGV
jgi:ribose 5-phosphate isomerase A